MLSRSCRLTEGCGRIVQEFQGRMPAGKSSNVALFGLGRGIRWLDRMVAEEARRKQTLNLTLCEIAMPARRSACRSAQASPIKVWMLRVC